MDDWSSFRAFTPTHAAVLAGIALLTALAIALRRRGPCTPAASAAERLVGWAYVAAWTTTYAYLYLSDLNEPAKTLPLQLCHWTALASALLLITRWATLRPIVYFWGLALCTQALITPALGEGPALYPFWFFWGTHGIIVGVAIYDIAARGYRPGWRDCALACVAAAAYVAIVLPLNLAFDWNYGFVGPGKPEVRSIVDALGPWPQRLAIIFALVAAVMVLLVLPWRLASRAHKGLQSPSSTHSP